MLENNDDYCKIMADDETMIKTSLNALLNVNIDKSVAERLLTEQLLEVRKYRSEKPFMENCAVVKCSHQILWNIPHKILQPIQKHKK